MINLCINDTISNLQKFSVDVSKEKKEQIITFNQFCTNAINNLTKKIGLDNIGDIIILCPGIDELDIYVQMIQKKENTIDLTLENAFYIDVDMNTKEIGYISNMIDDFCDYNFITIECIEKRFMIYRKEAPTIIRYLYTVTKSYTDLSNIIMND